MFDIENDINGSDQKSDNCENDQKDCLNNDYQKKLESTLTELENIKDKFSRLNADFQNYQKRVDSDRILQIDRMKADLFLGILSIVDNFDRAIDAINKKSSEENNNEMSGFLMMHKMFYDWLSSQKVTVITQVTLFDPNLHEAVMQVTQGDIPSGNIVTVFEKGFMYKDSVLRTAKVSVRA